MPATPTRRADPGAHVGGKTRVQKPVDELDRRAPLRRGRRVVGEEALGDAHGAHVEAADEARRPAGSADGELGAAAADVDDRELGGVRLERRRGAAKGEARLLLPVDDAVRQAEVALDRGEKGEPVGGVAQDAGGDEQAALGRDRRRRAGRRSRAGARVRAAASPSSRPVRSTPCPSRTTCVSRLSSRTMAPSSTSARRRRQVLVPRSRAASFTKDGSGRSSAPPLRRGVRQDACRRATPRNGGRRTRDRRPRRGPPRPGGSRSAPARGRRGRAGT